MNFIELTAGRRPDPFSVECVVPAQPAGGVPGLIYLGGDIGWLRFTGAQPRPGDLVVVVGEAGDRVAMTGQQPEPLRAAVFDEDCRCKCPGKAGTIFWANPIQTGPYLVIMDGDGNLLQTLNPPQLFRVAGIAVDAAAPHAMYVLDDRTRLGNFRTDASPAVQVAGVSTYALHTFQNGGTGYAWASVAELPDPGLPEEPFFDGELQWVDGLAGDGGLADPPAAYPTNCMSVLSGVLHITMSLRPARYLTWNGSGFATHSLTLNGAPFNKGLRGMILSGIDQPGRKSDRYVLAWLGYAGFGEENNGGYEILQFNQADRITRHFANDAVLQSPIALALTCNRVLVLNSNRYGRTEDGGSGSLAGTSIQHGSPP